MRIASTPIVIAKRDNLTTRGAWVVVLLAKGETGNTGIEVAVGFVSSVVALVTGAGALLTLGVVNPTVVDKVVVFVVGVTLGTTVVGAAAIFFTPYVTA